MQLRNASRITLVLLFSAAILMPQTPSRQPLSGRATGSAGTVQHSNTTSGITFNANGLVEISGMTTTSPLPTAPSGSILWINADGTVTSWRDVTPAETRKPSRQPSISEVRASAALLRRDVMPAANYLVLAAKINLDSASVDEARMLEAINELGLKVYNYDKVDAYLYNQALKQGTQVRWVWKPLRGKDLEASSKSNSWSVQPSMGVLFPDVYPHAVPPGVLSKVATVLEKLPDAVFLVSDYEVIKPDPFLAITTAKLLKQNKIWIIEQWDEPGFRDGSTVEVISIASNR